MLPDMKSYLVLFSMSDEDLLDYLFNSLKSFYPSMNIFYHKEKQGGGFLYARGKIPVLLVAHADTFSVKKPSDIVFLDDDALTAIDHPLGADDRAGVIAILEILKRGLKPHVLITGGEEVGCIGAESACVFLKAPRVNYIVEIDREGYKQCVFYDCANKEFKRFVKSFGFFEMPGTFSDISILCPSWNVAGVNLSAGYYDQHTEYEILIASHLSYTIEKLIGMLSTDTRKYDFVARKCKGKDLRTFM